MYASITERQVNAEVHAVTGLQDRRGSMSITVTSKYSNKRKVMQGEQTQKPPSVSICARRALPRDVVEGMPVRLNVLNLYMGKARILSFKIRGH